MIQGNFPNFCETLVAGRNINVSSCCFCHTVKFDRNKHRTSNPPRLLEEYKDFFHDLQGTLEKEKHLWFQCFLQRTENSSSACSPPASRWAWKILEIFFSLQFYLEQGKKQQAFLLLFPIFFLTSM